MGKDSANAAERIRPGITGTGGVTLGQPGSSVSYAFTVADIGAGQQIRATPAYGDKNKSQYVSVRVITADGTGCHVAFGDSSIPAVTNANAPQVLPGDGWQDFQLYPTDTHVRFKGDTASGTLEVLFPGV